MFKRNENLRAAGERITMTPEELQEYLKCKHSIFHFENYFTIIAADGEHPIKLREYQERLVKSIITKVPEKNNRIIMMGRQSGKTTIATLYLTWYALFRKSKTIAILANKAEQANEIMLRIQQAYMNLPLWLQQGIIKWNQGEMILENKCRMFSAASSSSSIRGKTVDLELVDEFAHLDDNVAEAFMQSVFPTQSSRPDSMLLLISTPKGMNHFYDIWQKAKSGRNSFIPCKVQWYEIDGRDEKWKDRVIRDNGIKFFAQEYACLCGNEKVTVQDDNGKILETTLKDLYEWQRDLPKPYK
jgi:phage terminase large subunit-like protein